MFKEVSKIGVFVIRNLRMLFTYKLAFSVSFLSIVFNFLYLVLFGTMFGTNEVSGISQYGGDFISYILIGSIGWGYLWSIMSSTSSGLRIEMMMGTLETILLTRTKLYTMMIAYALYGILFGIISMAILVVIGLLMFGFSVFATANIYTILIFVLSGAMMMGFGMFFGGLTIWLKNIGQTVPLIQNITTFFCGVYFPITVLPGYLQPIHKFIPFYYPIEGLRLSLLPSPPEGKIIEIIIIIGILTVIFGIIGLFTLKKGLEKAKKDGSLAYY